ncbi:MAG TPA: hypothetical protein VIC34_16035 [Croceibacterium sp.]|jgi:hypothetical protein
MTKNSDRGSSVVWCAPGYENAKASTREPQVWTDARGNEGSELDEVRTLVPSQGYAHVTADREERVQVPAGSHATVLYVNSDARIVGVEFGGDVEGNTFGNVGWDEVEILNRRPG